MNQKQALAEALDEIQKNLTEIAELKADIESLEGQLAVTIRVCNENTDLKKLITELADALSWYIEESDDGLIHHAREATK